MAQHLAQSRSAFYIQVLRLLLSLVQPHCRTCRLVSRQCHTRPRVACRHIILYISGAELHHRCISRRYESDARRCCIFCLYLLLPPACRRSYRACNQSDTAVLASAILHLCRGHRWSQNDFMGTVQKDGRGR